MIKVKKPRIFTIGHSTRKINEFLDILNSYKLKLLIDIRTVPKSRFNPQFGGQKLKTFLNKNGIDYIHMSGLGGFRKTAKNSVNKGWRNSAFRGFADYMQTGEFKKNLKKLISKSKRKRLVIMCAEAVPWRCHRSLISDALLVQGYKVEDIFTKTSHKPHKLTPFAKIKGGQLTYP
jgi:uncharacterized protein (DUF488 family)